MKIMRNGERYPFVSSDPTLGEASFHPYLPFTLVHQQVSVTASALLDTGASVNVLPYSIGIELGYEWERQTTALSLTGNLAQYEARVVLVQAVVGQFKPVNWCLPGHKLQMCRLFWDKSTFLWSSMFVSTARS
jgi:hypothetical protein